MTPPEIDYTNFQPKDRPTDVFLGEQELADRDDPSVGEGTRDTAPIRRADEFTRSTPRDPSLDSGMDIDSVLPTLVQERPAEVSTGAAALAVLIAYFAGLDDPEVLVALAVVIGLVPASVTWLVNTLRRNQ